MVHSTEVTPPFMTGWLINKFFQGREQIKWKMAALFESGILTALESKGTNKEKTWNAHLLICFPK